MADRLAAPHRIWATQARIQPRLRPGQLQEAGSHDVRLRDPGHAMAGLACTEPAQKAGSEAASLEGGPPSQLAPCKRSPSWCVRGPHRLPKPQVMAFAKLGRRTPSGTNNPPCPRRERRPQPTGSASRFSAPAGAAGWLAASPQDRPVSRLHDDGREAAGDGGQATAPQSACRRALAPIKRPDSLTVGPQCPRKARL